MIKLAAVPLRLNGAPTPPTEHTCRYFATPLLFLALHLPLPSRCEALAVLACYLALNVATTFLFLYRPYRWGADGTEEARFMW